MRFSKYLPRKYKLNKSNNEVSYIEPYNYELNAKKNNKIIDFKKMKSRNDLSFINGSSLEVPSIGKYHPKYTLVENKTKNILFNRQMNDNQKNKKILLNKLLGSYKVMMEYQTINNKKLFSDNDLIRKQLIINHNCDMK